MIIKKMDSKEEEIAELTALLKGRLTSHQGFLMERELKTIRAGGLGDKDSDYHIGFYFGRSKNWAVIHDLRLEHKGQVAQIDHLLINRFFDMYVLESKNYTCSLKSPLKESSRRLKIIDSADGSGNESALRTP